MNAREMLDVYVTEVAVALPRGRRDDVACELRSLLEDELQARAEAAGREADPAMALELLQAFGRPTDVAKRYLPTLTVIDPTDGRAFVRASLIGLAIIWGVGLLTHLPLRPIGSTGDFLQAIGHWWSVSFIPSFWWPGVLVAGFAIATWVRSQSSTVATWTPRDPDRIGGGRATLALGIVGVLCGVFVLLQPTRILDVVWGGRAAPEAYQALTYTDGFLRRQAWPLLLLLSLNVPLLIAGLRAGRWTPRLRRLWDALALLECAVILWAVLDGPVMRTTRSDQFAKGLLVLIVVATLFTLGLQRYRRVTPAPAPAR